METIQIEATFNYTLEALVKRAQKPKTFRVSENTFINLSHMVDPSHPDGISVVSHGVSNWKPQKTVWQVDGNDAFRPLFGTPYGSRVTLQELQDAALSPAKPEIECPFRRSGMLVHTGIMEFSELEPKIKQLIRSKRTEVLAKLNRDAQETVIYKGEGHIKADPPGWVVTRHAYNRRTHIAVCIGTTGTVAKSGGVLFPLDDKAMALDYAKAWADEDGLNVAVNEKDVVERNDLAGNMPISGEKIFANSIRAIRRSIYRNMSENYGRYHEKIYTGRVFDQIVTEDGKIAEMTTGKLLASLVEIYESNFMTSDKKKIYVGDVSEYSTLRSIYALKDTLLAEIQDFEMDEDELLALSI